MKNGKFILTILFLTITIPYLTGSIDIVFNNKMLIGLIRWSRIISFLVLIIFIVVYKKKWIVNFPIKLAILSIPLLLNISFASEPFFINYLLLIIGTFIFHNLERDELYSIIYSTSIFYSVMLFILVILTHFNLFDLNTLTVNGSRARNTLGFNNENAASTFLITSTIGFMFLNKKWSLIFSLLLSLFIFLLTDTRAILLLMLIISFYLLSEWKLKYKKVAYLLSILIILPLFASPFLLSYIMNIEIYGISLNFLSSNRFSIAESLLQSALANSLMTGDFSAHLIDYLYANLLMTTGILFYAIFAFFTWKAIVSYKDNNIISLVILSFLIFNMIETFYSPANLFSLIFLFLITKNGNNASQYNVT